MPMIALYGEVSTGHRERGAPNSRYKHSLTNFIRACHVDHLCWSDMAANRDAWRHLILKAIDEFEENRLGAKKDKRS